MDKISRLISTNGIIHKSKSSFGNYRVESKRLWQTYNGNIKVVDDCHLFFRVKEAKEFIKGLPIIT